MENTAQTQSRNTFIKPLSKTKGYEVYMHSVPDVGEVFYRIVTDKRHKPQVEQLQLVDVQQVRESQRSGLVSILYWKSNISELGLASVARSKRIVRFKEKNPLKQAEKLGAIKGPSQKPKDEGTWALVTVKHPNRRSQQIIQEKASMQVVEVRPKNKILYWQDKQGKYYWGNTGETVVRPFPEKRKTTNCSDNQNA